MYFLNFMEIVISEMVNMCIYPPLNTPINILLELFLLLNTIFPPPKSLLINLFYFIWSNFSNIKVKTTPSVAIKNGSN